MIALSFFCILIIQTGSAQKKHLTYRQAFERGEPRLSESLSSPERWLDDTYYLLRNRSREGSSIMKVNALTGEETVYFDYHEFDDYLPEDYNLARSRIHTDDYKKFIFIRDNDLYIFETEKKQLRQLTDNGPEEQNPTFSPDASKIAFTRENNLFVLDIESGKETQLTNDGGGLIYNGWASWVYYEEILGRRSRYQAFWWSPDSKMIAYLRFDDSPVPMFPIFRAEGTHGELEKTRYPKAGDPNPLVKLGVVHLESGTTTWLDNSEKDDHYVAWPFWSPDSKILVFQHLNRDQDDMRFIAANPVTGEAREIYHEQQDSWVEFFEDVHVFQDGSGFLLRSDKSGWRNLYYYDFNGNLISQVTSFNWRIRGIERVVDKTKTVYFTGTGGISTESHLYSIKLNGKGLTKLTSIPGNHNPSVSPGGSLFYDVYSNIQTPAKHEVFDSKGKSVRFVGDSKLPEMDEYNLGKAELITVPTEDGYNLPMTWILPPDFDDSKKYPVIISIYGGPDAGNVNNSFPFSLSGFWYAQNGIIYVSVDHRASGHYGKKGVSLMHRNLGKWEMNDYIEAVKWLEKKPFINGDKIGITGGSYGGYTTCMALTYGADYFNYGVANYSVTDWHLYDNVYTERYMDTPEQNPEGYEFGSALTHAEKYKGKLLITHGTMDDNVHMQNTIQLVDVLQDLGKEFELMLYPGERHGWDGPKREHLNKMTVNFWFENLLERKFIEEE
ncbi:MAG: peptidase [Bacteroides sp. SM23_62_1]|nr:MAG: peptidase [Bacteroides sp. SM23_62_1]